MTKGNSINHNLRLFLLAMVALGAMAALWIGFSRFKIESNPRHRNIELVSDWVQVQQMSALTGISLDSMLQDLKAHGITSVAVGEDTVAGLRDDGFLTIEADPTPEGGARTIVSSFNTDLLNRVQEHLTHKLRLKTPLETAKSKEGNPAFIWPGSFEQIRAFNVGLPPAEVARLRSAGLGVIARIVNYPAADPANIEWSLHNLSRMGVQKVIFGGEEVLGFQAQTKTTAELLQREGLTYGSVEFSKQRGDEDLTRLLKGQYLRVHSITPDEMKKLKPAEMVERYVRGAEERNIRLALVRFIPYVTKDGWQDQLTFLDGISRGVRGARLSIGPAKVMEPVAVPVAARWIIGVGLAAAVAWGLTLLVPLDEGLVFLVFAGLSVVHVGLLVGTAQIGRKLIALEAAIVFPTVAMLVLYGFVRYRLREQIGFNALGAYLATSLGSLLGAVYVVGLLSSREYMVKAQQFVGIKGAHFLPLLILGIVFSLDFVTDHRTLREMTGDARKKIRDVLAEPILVWQLIAVGFGLIALALLLLRTGNDPGVGVSPMEMRFRALLDRVLYVRPRTKEFLIGHPALVLGLFWAGSQIRRKASTAPAWALSRGGLVVLLLVGAIGQVSLVNTFCHIHTPLAISLIRIFNGLWIGALLGVALFRLLPKARVKAGLSAPREATVAVRGR